MSPEQILRTYPKIAIVVVLIRQSNGFPDF